MVTKFAIAGDVHGDFEALATVLKRAQDQYGPVEFALLAGDVQANRSSRDAEGVVVPARYRQIGDFPRVMDGELDFEVPVYFIAGNHDPYPALEENGPGQWASNFYWLGRSGIKVIEDLRVAFLSGIYSSKYSELRRPIRDNPRTHTYWHWSDLEALRTLTAEMRPVDVLLTHEWPSGLLSNSAGQDYGQIDIRRLVDSIAPQIHACGHIHKAYTASIGATTVICLAKPSQPGGMAVVEKNEMDLNAHIVE